MPPRRRGSRGPTCKNLVNEAALLAARREQNEVRHKDFLDALEKIVLGPERPIILSRADKERIAYHEGGHAILGLVVPGADPVNRVTIVPRGHALGVTYQRPDSDRYNYPEGYLRARIVGMLGGRAAEEIVYGTKTTGAESDIEQATALARRMVTRWGMSERLGLVQLAPRENPYLGGSNGYAGARPFSEATAAAIDAEVLKIIGESHDEAKRLLSAHREQLDALVEALLSRETLNEQEILEVTGLPPAPALDTGMLPVPGAGSRSAPREWVMTSIAPVVTLSPRDYDAVLFDLDGVLTKTASVHAAAWKRLFDGFLEQRAADMGEPLVPFDIEADYRRYVDGKPRYDGVAAFLEDKLGEARAAARAAGYKPHVPMAERQATARRKRRSST